MRLPQSNHTQNGFTYLVVLMLVAMITLAVASVTEVWHTKVQREKERELLFVGKEFRTAIGRYYEQSPGSVKRYPPTMDDLLKDSRQLATQRYLRKVYVDPITLKAGWGMVLAPNGGIMGVYSLSDKAPVKVANFPKGDEAFEGKQHYFEWQFVYLPKVPAKTSTPTAK